MPDYEIKVRLTKRQTDEWAKDLQNELLDAIYSDIYDETGVEQCEAEDLKIAKSIDAQVKRFAKAEIPNVVDAVFKIIKEQIKEGGFADTLYDNVLYSWVEERPMATAIKGFVTQIQDDPKFVELAEKHQETVRERKLAELQRLADSLGVKLGQIVEGE